MRYHGYKNGMDRPPEKYSHQEKESFPFSIFSCFFFYDITVKQNFEFELSVFRGRKTYTWIEPSESLIPEHFKVKPEELFPVPTQRLMH